MNDLRTAALRDALAQQKDPTDPGRDVDVLREHVRHLERRVRQLHAQQAEPVAGVVLNEEGRAALVEHGREEWHCVSRNARRLYTAPPQRKQAEPLNLSDPAVQKRLASQWGYVPAAQAEPVGPVAWAAVTENGKLYKAASTRESAERKAEQQEAKFGDTWRPLHVVPLYTAPPQRKPLTEKEMYAVEEEARKNFRLSQKGPRGQQITYWDGLTPWLIRAVERAHGIKE